MDIDLLIDTELQNEINVFKALEYLPDKAVRELTAGDVSKYQVVRIADEIVIDLLKSANDIDYKQASSLVIIHCINGVNIPFAIPELLSFMKQSTYRAKDQEDISFLKKNIRHEQR